MVKEGSTWKGTSAETKPTEIDPTLTSMPVREGENFYEADTGNVFVFLNGEWVTPQDSQEAEDSQEGE